MILVNENIQSTNDVYNNCNEKFLPQNLLQYPLYTKVNELINTYDKYWTNQELLSYFDEGTTYEKYFVSTDGAKEILYTKDFYQSYPSTIDEIWYETALINDININKDGVGFWKFMFEPYLGTHLIQEKLLEKADVNNGTVIEWFNTEVMVDGELTEIAKNLVGMYSLKMDTYPGDKKAIFLIQSSLKIKNAESKLTSVTDSQCPSALRLNIGELNKQRMNGNFINFYFDIGLCFTTRTDMLIDVESEFRGTGDVNYSGDYFDDDGVLVGGVHPHTYNGGIALGEFNGVSYEDIPAIDILTMHYDQPSIAEYEALITGAQTDYSNTRIKTTTLFAETIPGVNLTPNYWDDRWWDGTLWETGSYIETIRDIVGDPTFNLTSGIGLTYPGFGYKIQFIKSQTFIGHISNWTYDGAYYKYVSAQDGDDQENGSVEKYSTGSLEVFETDTVGYATMTHHTTVFTHIDGGLVGNDVTITIIVSGINTAQSIVVTGSDIVFNSATDGTGVATDTEGSMKDALNADVNANVLILSSILGDGLSIVEPLVETTLKGGSDGTVNGTQYVLKFKAVVDSGTAYVSLDGTYMPTAGVTAISNVTIGANVEFVTGDVELAFTASGAHTIGVISNDGEFNVDAFSVEEYTPVTVDGVVVNVLAPSIYKTESVVQQTESIDGAEVITYTFG